MLYDVPSEYYNKAINTTRGKINSSAVFKTSRVQISNNCE